MTAIHTETFICPCPNPTHRLTCTYQPREMRLYIDFPLTQSYQWWQRWWLYLQYLRGRQTIFWDEILLTAESCRKILNLLLVEFISVSPPSTLLLRPSDPNYQVTLSLERSPDDRAINPVTLGLVESRQRSRVRITPEFDVTRSWYQRLCHVVTIMRTPLPWIQITLNRDHLGKLGEFLSQTLRHY